MPAANLLPLLSSGLSDGHAAFPAAVCGTVQFTAIKSTRIALLLARGVAHLSVKPCVPVDTVLLCHRDVVLLVVYYIVMIYQQRKAANQRIYTYYTKHDKSGHTAANLLHGAAAAWTACSAGFAVRCCCCSLL
jgi:hypothetical protein